MNKKSAILQLTGICGVVISGCAAFTNDYSTDLEESTLGTINDFSGVSMSVLDETVSPTGLTVEFENDSDQQVIYGEDFLLETNVEDSWYQVPVIIEDEYGFDAIGYELSPGETDSLEIDWEWLYGSLESGEYRIMKEVLDFRGAGDFDEYQLTAEFIIE